MGLLVRGNRYTKLKTKNNLRFLFCLKFIILDPMSQHLCFKLFDRDNVNEDDFLGRFVRSLCNFLNCFFFRYSGEVDIGGVLKGNTDQWIQLENAKHGLLHLRFTWLSLSAEINLLNAVSDYLPIFYFCDGANIFI